MNMTFTAERPHVPKPEGLCPGKEQRIKDAKDLEPVLFRRLVVEREVAILARRYYFFRADAARGMQ